MRNSIVVLWVLFIFCGDVYAQSRPAKKGKGKAKAAVEEKKEAPKKEELWTHSGGTLLNVSFAADGKSAVSVNSEGTIFFWDAESGKKIRSVHHGIKATAATFFGNKKVTLAGGLDKDNAIFILDLSNRKETQTIAGHKGGTKTLAFSTDGENVLSGGWNNQIVLWGGEHGDILRVFKDHDEAVNAVAVSPDRVIAASGSADGKIKIWNMSTGELVQTIKAHKKGVLKVAFSPDGKTILSGGIEKGKAKKDIYPLQLWELATGKPLGKTNFTEYKQALTTVLFSPNGKFILSGERAGTSTPDETLQLWDMASAGDVIPKGATPPQPMRTFEGHAGKISTASFSPDGTRVLAGGDGTLTIWETETGKVLGGGKPPATEKPKE